MISLSVASRSFRKIAVNEYQLPLDTENLLFRLKGGIELEGVTSKIDGIKAGFKEAIKELISKVNSEAFVLNGFGGSLYIWPKAHASTQPSELQDDTQCKAILKYVTVEVSDLLQKASNIQFLKIVPLKIINMQILFEMVQADNTEEVVIHHRKMSHIHFKLVLPIDVVVLANPEEPWGKVQDQFVEAVTAQLSAMDNCIERYTNGKTVPIPQAFHFELPEKTTLTTVIYPAGISDTNLEQQRKELQTELGLDNKPYFRRPMVYVFPSAERETKYLKNVHKYIPALNPDDYKVSLVHGSYTFHHCLQDNEKDKKWGALYRCLQVVISWFKFQGYIDKPVPTVKEIREMLIKMDEEFVPIVLANEWLAPDEMLPFLEFYNISCSSTEERAKPDEPMDLSTHFQKHGTPVVIWKTVMFAQPKACILLGMAVSKDSSTRKVLILDTMYRQSDDLARITEVAVSWQGKEFWTEMAQFGLIMPKRPEGV